MTDIETVIERDLERAEQIRGRENRHRWLLALLASRTVGRRIPGLTVEFARRCGLAAPDAVEHWAKAQDLYKRIRFVSAYCAVKFRYEFTVSHFNAMSDLESKYNLSISKVIAYFREILTYKERGESWSVATLKAEVEAHENKNQTPVNVDWHWNRLDKHMIAIASFPDLDPLRRAFVKVYLGVKERIK